MHLSGQDLTTMIRAVRILCERTSWVLLNTDGELGVSPEWVMASEADIEAKRVLSLLEEESHSRSVLNGTGFPGHSQR